MAEIKCDADGLTLDDRLELYRYMAFRLCRSVRDANRDREGKKLLTRVMRRLRKNQ